MKRKFLSLVLALVMVLGTVSAVFAETTPLTTNDSKVQWLVDNEVVVGRTVNKDDTNPDLALDKTITRAEVSKLLVYTLGQQKLADVLKGAILVFPDVNLDHWANGFVSVLATNRTEVASGRDVVIGYEDGTFRPSNDVTYAELATMLVRIVKKDLTKKMEDEAKWATSYIRWAEELGILEGITLVNSDAPAVRKDAFVMIYNAMHKLGLVGGNRVNWGIKIGVISKLQAGKMEINQDKEQVYNLTYNTVVTNETNWNQVNVNTVVPGSLVRFIADENGNVSHLMIVSFPTFGDKDYTANEAQNLGKYSGYHYTDNNRIFDLGTYVAGGTRGLIKLTNTYRPKAGFIVTENNDETTAKTIVPINSTRYFVADATNNALREVKSIDEALKVYNPDRDTFKGYVIYNEAEDYAGNKILEASYVVFTEVDKFDKDVLRVRYVPNGLYNVELEGPNPKMEIVHRNLFVREYLPTTYNILNKLDVVSLKYAGNGPTQDADIRINSKTFNVYVVTGIGNRFMYLKDKYGLEARVGLPEDTIVFGPLKVGAHVQIDREATIEDVKIVSVVPFALQGEMQFEAKDTGLKTALFISVSNLDDPVQNGYAIVTVADKIRTDGILIGERSYLVSVDKARELFENMKEGTKVQFIVEEGWNYAEGKRYANSFVDVAAAEKEKADKDAAKAFDELSKDLPNTDNINADNFADRYEKAKAAADAYAALSDEAKLLVTDENKTKAKGEIEKINAYIDAGNSEKDKLTEIE